MAKHRKQPAEKDTVRPTILIVEDDEPVRRALASILSEEGYVVWQVGSAEEALSTLEQQKTAIDVVLCDLKLPRISGMELLEQLHEKYPSIPVIVITGHGSEEVAFEAARKGAYDYLSKPVDLNRLLVSVRNAIERSALVREVTILRKRLQGTGEVEFIGVSPALHHIRELVLRVAPTDVNVLIEGESGVGKEVVARLIHLNSPRREGPFVAVNCGAIPSELVESELFGHEKGAFTSAVREHMGKFEQAQGGTLFLDEIGEMPLAVQVKLLRAIEEKKIYRVGGEKPIEVNVRLISATNQDLQRAVQEGRFRLDLLHRINTITIRIPPLRERPEDIPVLAEHFLRQLSEKHGIPRKVLSPEAMELLCSLPWKGNVRELRNAIERLLILVDGDTISADDVRRYVAQ